MLRQHIIMIYSLMAGPTLDQHVISWPNYVAMHFEIITHFENFFQSALNLGPNQRTLKIFFKVR